jgi:predicted DNA-binding protein
MAEKNVTLTVRLTPEDKMRIKRCAKEAGRSISDYVMAAVRERLKRDEVPPEERSDLDLLQKALSKITGSPGKAADVSKLEEKSLSDLVSDYIDKDK